LGWKGFSTNKEKILGTITDDVVNLARTDIILAKIVGDKPIKRILLPTAGGEHAQCAEQYALAMLKDYHGTLTVCQVAFPGMDETRSKETLKEAEERLATAKGVTIESKLIQSDSISMGIGKESENYDAVMVGAAGKSIYPQIMFGNIPEEIARNTNRTVIVVKHYHPVKALLGRVVGD
jgi:nucleotide-binding universal stress UspA family protein